MARILVVVFVLLLLFPAQAMAASPESTPTAQVAIGLATATPTVNPIISITSSPAPTTQAAMSQTPVSTVAPSASPALATTAPSAPVTTVTAAATVPVGSTNTAVSAVTATQSATPISQATAVPAASPTQLLTSTATTTPTPTATRTVRTAPPLTTALPTEPPSTASPIAQAANGSLGLIPAPSSFTLNDERAGTPGNPSLPIPGYSGRPGQITLLNVPHRYQFDGSNWANANCGPASLAMVLAAYDINLSNADIRTLANGVEGTPDRDVGVTLDTLAAIALDNGLEPGGLRAAGGAYARWTLDDLRREVSLGKPVITLVRFAALPGNEASGSPSDHFVVIVGTTPDGFLLNDPAALPASGQRRPITDSQLSRAWSESTLSGHALVIGSGPGRQPAAVAYLTVDEWTEGQATGSGTGFTAEPATVSPLAVAPTLIAVQTTQPAVPAVTVARSTRTPAPNRWDREPKTMLTPSAIPTEEPLVLAATADSPRDLRTPLAIIAAGVFAGVAILRRPARP